MAVSSENLQALIDETEALNCEDPSTLETFPLTAPQPELYRIVAHVDKIMELGNWNIKGSLLVLKPWTPDLTFDEVIPILCPFWIQAHGLPLQNMTAHNAISIAKSLGTLSPVVPGQPPVLVSTHHLRFRVAIDTTRPLVPGFSLPRPGKSAIWIRYLYERLADYCTFCGLIGHMKSFCPAPPPQGPQDKYGISLRAFVLSGPRSSYVPSLPITISSTIQHDTAPTTPDIASALICVPSSPMKSPSFRNHGAQVFHQCTMQLGAQVAPTQTVYPPYVAPFNPHLRSSGQEFTSSLVGPSSDKGKGLLSSLDFSAHAMDQATLHRFLLGLSSPPTPTASGPIPPTPPSPHNLTHPSACPLTPYPSYP
jgi:hypothetical protein